MPGAHRLTAPSGLCYRFPRIPHTQARSVRMAKSSQARASRSAHLTGNGAVGKALNSRTDRARQECIEPLAG